jgi:hypothetical protein
MTVPASQMSELINKSLQLVGMLHPVEVRVNAGGSITTIDHGGTRMEAGNASGRGVRIEIEFESEQGDGFEIAFQFHKGETEATIRPVYKRDEGPTPTIWRD